jgi:hypothetical protein
MNGFATLVSPHRLQDRPACRAGRKTKVSSNLTLIVVLVSAIHVAVLALMIWIRVRRTEGDGIPAASSKTTPCSLCGEPATDWGYDGLDPNEQLDSRTGRAWSADASHYRPLCAAHSRPLCAAH